MSNIQEKIDNLLGSCESIFIEDFTHEELRILDEQIFCCDQCGWWCETGEQDENNICEDCRE